MIHTAFRLLRRHAVKSRAGLAKFLGVSRPTSSILVEQLLNAGWIRETSLGISTGGKKPILLEINPGAFHSIGVDIGYDESAVAVKTDAAGTVLQQAQFSFQIKNARTGIARLREKIQSLFGEDTFALALPGNIAPDGRILQSIRPELTDPEFVRNLPGPYGNRARFAALSEYCCGAAANRADFALISLGKSIGSALFIDGRLLDGGHSRAGELRTLPIPTASGGFLPFEEAVSKAGSLPERLDCCEAGLSQLQAVIDPDLIVLAGKFAEFGDDFSARLSERIQCNVRPAAFGAYSAARGAALQLIPPFSNSKIKEP